MTENTVSVIIPTHNRPEQLRRAVRSVLNQTYTAVEIIVADDASTKDVEAVVKELGDERISYVRQETNKGAPAARNMGFRQSRGEYVLFLDDDDELLPEQIERLVQFSLEQKDKPGMVGCGFYYKVEGAEKKYHPTIPPHDDNMYRLLLRSNIFIMHSLLIRRECIEQAGYFDEALVACQDWDLWIRIAREYTIAVLPEILARHTVHGEQMTSNLERKITAREQILDKYKETLEKHPGILSFHRARLGKLHFLAGDRSTGRRYLKQAFKAEPSNLKFLLHLALSILNPSGYRKILEKRQFKVGTITFY